MLNTSFRKSMFWLSIAEQLAIIPLNLNSSFYQLQNSHGKCILYFKKKIIKPDR